ncbi:MAG: hypothetical protein HY260_01475, partial [Chloroflexi bacterium]|nr:hypothetical protein [Chloroflexota bacterium]
EGDYSALEVAVGDLYGAYCAIYEEFVPAFLNAPDRETAADALMDLLLEFNHIVWHVQIAEGALTALVKSLDRHGEVPPKSERRPVAAAVRERRAVYSTRNGKPKRRSPARRTGRRAARKQ